MKTNQIKILLIVLISFLLTSCGVDYTPSLDPLRSAAEVDNLDNRVTDGKHLQKYDNILVLVDDTDSMLESYKGRTKRNFAYDLLDRIKLTLGKVDMNRAVRIFSIHADRTDFQSQLVYGMRENFSSKLKPAIITRVPRNAMLNPLAMAIDAVNNELKIIPGNTAVIIISDFAKYGQEVEYSASVLKQYYNDSVCLYPMVLSDKKELIAGANNICSIDGCGFKIQANAVDDPQQLTEYLEKVLYDIAVPPVVASETTPSVKSTPVEQPEPQQVVAQDPPESALSYENLLVEKELVVHLKTTFNLDEAIIREEDYGQLHEVAEFMKKYLDVKTTIEGHTCDLGNEEYNVKLSKKRADSIKRYLVETFKIDSSRLNTKGYGESRPIADNSTEEGREKNRRAEAVISTIVMEREKVEK